MDYTHSLNMLRCGIKSFDLWKAEYDYMMSLSQPANVPAVVDIIFTLLYLGRYVIKGTSLSFFLNVTVFLRTEGN
jgi:hypothetical protein